MKITVSFTIELDPKLWDMGRYAGLPAAERNQEVTADVRDHVYQNTHHDGLLQEIDATVTRTR